MLKSKDRDESHENEDQKTTFGINKKTTYGINKIERVDWTKKSQKNKKMSKIKSRMIKK